MEGSNEAAQLIYKDPNQRGFKPSKSTSKNPVKVTLNLTKNGLKVN